MNKDFDNVKLIIQDDNGNYLVGRRYGTRYKYSSIGGHREKDETIGETLARELMEETSGLLRFFKDKNQYYIKDNKYKYPVEVVDLKSVKKKIYVLIHTRVDLSEHISRWKLQFHKNQENIIFDEIEDLYKKYPSISRIQWIEYLLKFKNDYSNRDLVDILQDVKLNKPEIRRILAEFEELGYYLEMDDIDLVSYRDLKEDDGLYEREFLNMLKTIEKN